MRAGPTDGAGAGGGGGDADGRRQRDEFVVTFVTGNAGKLREVLAVVGDTLSLRNEAIDLPELQGTPEAIARTKSVTAAQRVNGAVLVEDTCLAFEALGGMPGPYVKWFLDAVGPKGLHTLLAGFDNKRASAICTIGYCAGPSEEPVLFQGVVPGVIVEPRGASGFGWDSVFQPDAGGGKTYAEMGAAEKNAISHRNLALAKLAAHFAGPAKRSKTAQ